MHYAFLPLNAYTFGVRIECLTAIFRQNAYMHEQVTKEPCNGGVFIVASQHR